MLHSRHNYLISYLDKVGAKLLAMVARLPSLPLILVVVVVGAAGQPGVVVEEVAVGLFAVGLRGGGRRGRIQSGARHEP